MVLFLDDATIHFDIWQGFNFGPKVSPKNVAHNSMIQPRRFYFHARISPNNIFNDFISYSPFFFNPSTLIIESQKRKNELNYRIPKKNNKK